MFRFVILAIMSASVLVAGCTPAAPAGVQRLSPQDYVTTLQASDHILIDVRTPGEFSDGYIEGAINIPLQELQQRLSEIPQDQDIVLYCRSGNRSAQAANILSSAGFSSIYDLGGTIQWQGAGYPLVR